MRGGVIRNVAIALAAAASLANAPASDGDRTTVDDIVPAVVDGRQVGCQMLFSVVRAKPKPGDVTGVRAALLSARRDDGVDIASVKLRVLRNQESIIPDSIVFVDGDVVADDERYDDWIAEGNRARLSASAGTVTRKAMLGLVARGTMRIAVRGPGPGVSFWTVDLSGDPALRQRWAECLSKSEGAQPKV